jgi:hypothetical protein
MSVAWAVARTDLARAVLLVLPSVGLHRFQRPGAFLRGQVTPPPLRRQLVLPFLFQPFFSLSSQQLLVWTATNVVLLRIGVPGGRALQPVPWVRSVYPSASVRGRRWRLAVVHPMLSVVPAITAATAIMKLILLVMGLGAFWTAPRPAHLPGMPLIAVPIASRPVGVSAVLGAEATAATTSLLTNRTVAARSAAALPLAIVVGTRATPV